MNPSAVPVLCLGEALVDLIGRLPGGALPEVGPFYPHPGGVAANVAVFVARNGVPVMLAGGAGDDAWGRWLRERLVSEGVDISRFTLVSGLPTGVAFVAVDGAGEPTYTLHGQTTGTVMSALSDAVEEMVNESAALTLSTNTLVRELEQAVTLRARRAALKAGRPVIFDANLRLARWRSGEEAVQSALACVPGALLLRANRREAEFMTGESDPERAAAALLRAGAEMVVLTLGEDGALLRGAAAADQGAVKATRVLNTAGAGDAMTGTPLAGLARGGFAPTAARAALPAAVAAAAAACERWGAVD